jgi:hypothetical protein
VIGRLADTARRLFSRIVPSGSRRRVEIRTRDVTLALFIEALFIAHVGEDEAFDPLSADVDVETCRRLCGVLFESFPARATDDALRYYAAVGWRAVEAARAEAIAWAEEERAILARLWGPPRSGAGLPLTNHLMRLGADDDGVSALAYADFMRLPLWQAFLFLFNRGVVVKGYADNAKAAAAARAN